MAGDEPLFSFGLLADAQYADLPHGNTEGRQQAYREVPSKLRASLAALRSTQPPLAFVVSFQLEELSLAKGGHHAVPPDTLLACCASILQACCAHLQMHLGDIVNGNPAGQEQCDREFDLVATIFEQELVCGHNCGCMTHANCMLLAFLGTACQLVAVILHSHTCRHG